MRWASCSSDSNPALGLGTGRRPNVRLGCPGPQLSEVDMNRMRRLLTRRPWITVLIVVIVAGGLAGGFWWFADRNANATAAASGPVNRLVAASVGTIKKSVTTTGTLTPADQEQVNFAATGTVTAKLTCSWSAGVSVPVVVTLFLIVPTDAATSRLTGPEAAAVALAFRSANHQNPPARPPATITTISTVIHGRRVNSRRILL